MKYSSNSPSTEGYTLGLLDLLTLREGGGPEGVFADSAGCVPVRKHANAETSALVLWVSAEAEVFLQANYCDLNDFK